MDVESVSDARALLDAIRASVLPVQAALESIETRLSGLEASMNSKVDEPVGVPAPTGPLRATRRAVADPPPVGPYGPTGPVKSRLAATTLALSNGELVELSPGAKWMRVQGVLVVF